MIVHAVIDDPVLGFQLGVELWSPRDLRHRRISLLHLRGEPWRIAEFVGSAFAEGNGRYLLARPQARSAN